MLSGLVNCNESNFLVFHLLLSFNFNTSEIPIFETSEYPEVIVDAVLCYQPGNYNGYKINVKVISIKIELLYHVKILITKNKKIFKIILQ